MLAQLWIDQEEFQVTKAEIELTHPISYLVGIAASLRALKFTIHQKRLTPEILNHMTDDEMYWAVRTGVILRHTGELPIEISGSDAEVLLNRVFTRGRPE